MAHTIITGSTSGFTAQSQTWQYPQRLEWQDFVQVPGNLTLLVLALQQFQAEDESTKLAYFQISGKFPLNPINKGIHGLPNVTWDEGGNKPAFGYCIHGLNTFPTWHRPYLALYEQCLTQYFPRILKQYQGTQAGETLANAAISWRLPYWDWAINPSLPNEVASPTVQILSPTGEMVQIDNNPLYQYTFQSDPEPAFLPYGSFGVWPTTLRQPSSTQADAVSQPDVVDEQIQSDDELKTKVLDLFPTTLPQPDPWGQFSNHSWDSIPGHQGHLTSIEEIHDRIHGYVGGPGHMGVVPFSAFDPVFWLHHCMIDRIFALWEAVYPGVYVSPGPGASGGTVNVNTPLTPFWNTQTAISTSVNCITTTKYGYIYPEIALVQTSDPEQLSTAVHQRVMELYGSGSFFNTFLARTEKKLGFAQKALAKPKQAPSATPPPVVKGNQIRLAIPQQRALPMAKAPRAAPAAPKAAPTESDHEEYVITPENYQDWIVNVTIEKYALNGSGRVCFFLGPEEEIPENSAEWYTSPIYVGAFTIFAQDPRITECGNCKDQAQRQFRIGGTVHLTKALIRRHIPLEDAEPVQYLKENLHWRVTDLTDRRYANEDLPSLRVIVTAAGMEIGPDGRVHRGPWTRYPEITQGRAGGAQDAGDI